MLKKKHRIIEGIYFSRYTLGVGNNLCRLCKFKNYCKNNSMIINDKSIYQLCMTSTIIEVEMGGDCNITYWPDPKKYTIHDKKLKKID